MKHITIILLLCNCFCYAQLPEDEGNSPARNTALTPLEEGPGVVGVFDGRTPCQEIAKELKQATTPDCIKIKWRLTLYQDPVKKMPATYKLEGFVFRDPPKTGKWIKVRGIKDDPDAVVYRLDPDTPGRSISLLKGNENVLFFLDKSGSMMRGDEEFSYTLNRTGK